MHTVNGWEEDDDLCPHCGGDGSIMACDGDGSDWGEDTYSGPMDVVIECRHCGGTGIIGGVNERTPRQARDGTDI